MNVLFQNYAKDSSIWSVTFQQILNVIPEQIIILKLDVEGTECKVNFKLTFFCIPESFDMNISDQLFYYTITFVNSHH